MPGILRIQNNKWESASILAPSIRVMDQVEMLVVIRIYICGRMWINIVAYRKTLVFLPKQIFMQLMYLPVAAPKRIERAIIDSGVKILKIGEIAFIA